MKPTKVQLPKGVKPEVLIHSIRERILFEDFFNRNPDFKINFISKVESNLPWDVIINSGGTDYVVEIKCRFKTMKFDDFFFEEKKFKSLTAMTNTDKAINNGTKALYINFFTDGAIIWNITKENRPDFFIRDSAKTTAFDSGREEKNMSCLKNKDGIIYKYENDFKIANEKSRNVFRYMWPGIMVPVINDTEYTIPNKK